jgi:hypothetical protein
MRPIITKSLLFLFVLAAFVGPFATMLTVEKSRRAERLISKEEDLVTAQKEVAQARYQYYIGVNDQKANLKEAMEQSKTQYDQLLKDQPGLIKANQTSVTQTVIKPVKVQKVVTQKVPVSSKSSSSPKASTKTKAS